MFLPGRTRQHGQAPVHRGRGRPERQRGTRFTGRLRRRRRGRGRLLRRRLRLRLVLPAGVYPACGRLSRLRAFIPPAGVYPACGRLSRLRAITSASSALDMRAPGWANTAVSCPGTKRRRNSSAIPRNQRGTSEQYFGGRGGHLRRVSARGGLGRDVLGARGAARGLRRADQCPAADGPVGAALPRRSARAGVHRPRRHLRPGRGGTAVPARTWSPGSSTPWNGT